MEMTLPTSVDECHRYRGTAIRKALAGCPVYFNSFPYNMFLHFFGRIFQMSNRDYSFASKVGLLEYLSFVNLKSSC